jgi:hypothetical protein
LGHETIPLTLGAQLMPRDRFGDEALIRTESHGQPAWVLDVRLAISGPESWFGVVVPK